MNKKWLLKYGMGDAMRFLFIKLKSRKTRISLLLVIFLLSSLGLAYLAQRFPLETKMRIREGISIEGFNFGGLTEEQAREQLITMAKLKVKWPQDAEFIGKEMLQEGEKGRLVALEETLQKLKSAPENKKLGLSYYPVEPMIMIDEITNLKYGLATSKEFHFLEMEDYQLLKQVSNKLYNQVIYPGEEFSLTRFLASIPESSRYPQAVTQLIARSLYHCVNQGELQLIEKWDANGPKIGSATTENISYGLGRDLKFRNNQVNPILLRISVDAEVLTIWFLTTQ
jgi:hypothetical protein